jgi:hypothetical protein
MIGARFISNLGHPPSVATPAGFETLTYEQVLLAFATSDTVTQAPVNYPLIGGGSVAFGFQKLS